MGRSSTRMAMLHTSNVSIITKITVDPTIMPAGSGLSIEQPAWDPTTKRFYTSVPIIANNPPGCNYGQLAGAITCHGGLLVIDPFDLSTPTATQSAPSIRPPTPGSYRSTPADRTAPRLDRMTTSCLGCTPGNNPSDTHHVGHQCEDQEHYAKIGNITGSDEVWFNRVTIATTWERRGARQLPRSPASGLQLGVVDANQRADREAIPQSSNSHSVAADFQAQPHFRSASCARRRWLDPVATLQPLARGFAAATNGCVAVYQHKVDDDDHDHDGDNDRDRRDRDDHDHGRIKVTALVTGRGHDDCEVGSVPDLICELGGRGNCPGLLAILCNNRAGSCRRISEPSNSCSIGMTV